jgi:Skp family chaperone for outer membrane proteins
MTIKTLLAGSALAISAAMLLPMAATAQVGGIASASPTDAIFGAKAWIPALTQIETTYKAQIDQIRAKGQQRQDLLAQLDTNKDKQVDDAELNAAVTANSPVVTQVGQLERDMQALNVQIQTAQAFVLDNLAERYKVAQQNLIRDRKISQVLTPEAFVYMAPTTDITNAITAEIDRVLPSAPVTPPPNWQVTPQSAQLLNQWQQFVQAQQQQLAQQQQAAAAQRPAGTPAVTPPAARPATPPAGTPARPATR